MFRALYSPAKKRRLPALGILRGNIFAPQCRRENAFELLIAALFVNKSVERVVGNKASRRRKIVEPRAECGAYIGGRGGLLARECAHIRRKGGQFDVHRLIGAERGQHAEPERSVFGERAVPGEVVGGVVGRAQKFHVRGADAPARRKGRFAHLFFRRVVNFGGGLRAYGRLNAEIFFQFQVAPYVDGVADAEGQYLRKREELFAVGGAARYFFFGHAAGAHQPPLVVVARQPELREVVKPLVFGDLPGAQMRVVVHDGQVFHTAVQFYRQFAAEQKVFVQKFHIRPPKLRCFYGVRRGGFSPCERKVPPGVPA